MILIRIGTPTRICEWAFFKRNRWIGKKVELCLNECESLTENLFSEKLQ